MKWNRRRLQFEQLEHRSMLAGTVTAISFGPPGPYPVLAIIGDGENNSIIIHQMKLANGAIFVKVQGVGTTIIGGVSIEDFNPRQTGTSFLLPAVDIHIDLGGGDDSLVIYNTNVPGVLDIDTGEGNDRLTMSNVHYIAPPNSFLPASRPMTILLGSGNDTAVLRNVSSTGNIAINAGDGSDFVALTRTVAGTKAPDSTLSVELGPGTYDILFAAFCSAHEALLSDTLGHNGRLTKVFDHFGIETDTGFGIGSNT